MGARKLLLLLVVAALTAGSGVASASVTLDFEDADGTNWNGNLYGTPIFGPAGVENSYHGFDLTGWRVYDKDGVEATYGTSSYLYVGTNGDRSIGRNSFDPQYISRADDFYFEGALLTADDRTDGTPQYSVTIELIGYNDGSQVWYDTNSDSFSRGCHPERSAAE